MTVTETLAALRRPDELYDLLDPDVMWYSTDVDSNCTCNDKDEAVACIERLRWRSDEKRAYMAARLRTKAI